VTLGKQGNFLQNIFVENWYVQAFVAWMKLYMQLGVFCCAASRTPGPQAWLV
jgi:hypothetical protein